MRAQRFHDLQVWKKAHAFVLEAYRFTSGFPKHELFGLTAQFRRAAVSVPANIAEGFKKRGRADKARFYNTAQGSLEECRYYISLSRDLGYGEVEALARSAEDVARMLDAYAQAVVTNASGF